MATYAGRPVFPAFFVDTAGNPQESVAVTVYNRGTLVKPTLYTDRTKATATANPFTTDAYGNAFPYLDPGDYDALVNGATIPFSVVGDPAEPVDIDAVTDALSGTLVQTTTYQRGGPDTPELLASLVDADIPQPRGVWYSEGIVYVAANEKFAAVDARTLAVLGVVTDTTNLLGGRDVWVSGRYAYVSADNSGAFGSIVVIDIANPAAMSVKSFIRTTALDGIHALHLVGHKLYTANSLANTLTAWDVSVPTRPPVLLKTYVLPQPSRIVVRNNHAFCSLSGVGGAGGLAVIDLRTDAITVLQHADLAGARGLVVDGTTAFLACTSVNTVAAIDISDLTTPIYDPARRLVDGVVLAGVRELRHVGDLLYGSCANANSVVVVDVNDPAAMSVLASYTHAALTGANGVALVPSHVDGVLYATGVDVAAGGLVSLRVPYKRQGAETVKVESIEAYTHIGTSAMTVSGPASVAEAVVTQTLRHIGDRIGENGADPQLPLLVGGPVVSSPLGERVQALVDYFLSRGTFRIRGESLSGIGTEGSGAVTAYTADMDLSSSTWSLRVKMRHATWAAPAAIQHILSRADEVGSIVPYEVRINSSNQLEVNATPTGGSAPVVQRYNGFGAARTPGETVDIGIVVDDNAGSRRARFYESTDDGNTWNLVATVTTGSTASVHAPGAYALRLGARRTGMIGGFDGEILLAEIRNGDLTTEPVATFDPSLVAEGAASPFVASGRTWTLHGAAAIDATTTTELLTEFLSDPDALVATQDYVDDAIAAVAAPQFAQTVTLISTGSEPSNTSATLAEVAGHRSRRVADLRGMTTAIVQASQSVVNGTSGVRVEYSINAGSSWATLDTVTGLVANTFKANAPIAVPAEARTASTWLRVLHAGDGTTASTTRTAAVAFSSVAA